MRLKYFGWLMLLLFAFQLAAQADSLGQLEQGLAQLDNPDEAVWLLDRMVEVSAKSDLKGMQTYAAQAVALAEGKLADTTRAKANLVAGKAYMYLASYDTASVLLDAALDLLDPLKQTALTATAHHWKGYVKANVREFGPAAVHYYQAVTIWEQLGNQKELVRTYSQLADLNAMQQEYTKAIDYAEQAIALLKKMDEPAQLAEALNNLSYTYVSNGNHAVALQYATESLQLWEQLEPGGRQVARVSNSRGNAHKYLGNYDEAIADYERCRSISEKIGFVRGLIVSTGNVGHVLILQKKYAEALPYNLRAIELMKESGDTRNLWENYMHVTTSYEGLGEYQNAYHYQQLFHAEKEREYEEKIVALQGGLAEKYEAGQRAATIVLQEEQLRKQRNFQWLLGGFAALLLLTSGLIYASLRSRQKANQQLAIANQALNKKNKENELLLREIHHRVKNNLQIVSSLLNLQSAGVTDQTALAAVQESRNRVRSMSLIHQKLYQGEQLASVEMKDYFETMGEAMLQSFGEHTERVKLNVEMPPIYIDVDTAIPVGLIVNELLTNSLKHAFPGKNEGVIELSLRMEGKDNLVLCLADNGVGVGQEPQSAAAHHSSSGFGNRLVQLLVQQLDGALNREDANGYTTIIRFTQPSKAA